MRFVSRLGGRLAIGLAIGLTLIACGCTQGPEPPPEIVVITIDTLRADRLGCYGHEGGLTPNLDRLAAGGVRFADASAPTPVTLPSHTTLFTGRYPSTTGVRDNGTFVVPDEEVTLAEVLGDAGYDTAAVVASYPLQSRYGLDQGFARYDDQLPGADASTSAGFFPERDAFTVTERALEVWKGMEGGRRFLWVHYFDPHAPYAAPEPFASRHEHPYDAEVAFVDEQVGRLLARLELRPDALVVVTSDHGEGLGEHGELTHGVFLYQTTMQVPLLIWSPGRVPQDTVIDDPVGLVDLAPTVAGLAGAQGLGELDGADLRRLLAGGPPPARRPIYGESFIPRFAYRFSELHMWREGSLKWIEGPEPELYDVAVDPAEAENLAEQEQSAGARMAFDLGEFIDGQDSDAVARAMGSVDESSREALLALGYMSAGGDVQSDGEQGRNPMAMATYIREYDRALGLLGPRPEEGLALLRTLIEQAPENYMARMHTATAFLRLGRSEEAERELESLVEQAPGYGAGRMLYAEVLGARGELDRAVEQYERAIAVTPRLAEPRYQLARLLERHGRAPEAVEACRAAVELEPDNDLVVAGYRRMTLGAPAIQLKSFTRLVERFPDSAALAAELGWVLRDAGDPDGARREAERAASLVPQHVGGALLSGELLLDQGQLDAATAHFRKTVETHPRSPRAHYGLGRVLAVTGRLAEAEESFESALEFDPELVEVYTFRAGILERQGSRAAAETLYRQALEIRPGDPLATQALARLESSGS